MIIDSKNKERIKEIYLHDFTMIEFSFNHDETQLIIKFDSIYSKENISIKFDNVASFNYLYKETGGFQRKEIAGWGLLENNLNNEKITIGIEFVTGEEINIVCKTIEVEKIQ